MASPVSDTVTTDAMDAADNGGAGALADVLPAIDAYLQNGGRAEFAAILDEIAVKGDTACIDMLLSLPYFSTRPLTRAIFAAQALETAALFGRAGTVAVLSAYTAGLSLAEAFSDIASRDEMSHKKTAA